ncbi:unnamed protein product [Brassicogethes aeneus]|uniref:Ankyrin repeat domain-containing protein 49 n=1 Tax=Brassicogethes aeneus TaxID=1431903 RepID=A0A9P0AU12_BRAAE|nr:unnamed protein product [Brassicogethes aeneus]
MMDNQRFMLSGWEDEENDIDLDRNPKVSDEKDMLEAAENGDLIKVKELFNKNFSLIHAIDQDKYTALHRACYGNHIEVVKFLIENGANISAKTTMLWEPLHSCCKWNNTECAAILIQHGADVNAQSEGGQTPLHIAASYGVSYNTVQLLLMDPNIKTDIKNNSGEFAEDIAKRSSKFYNVFEMADSVLKTHNLELLS